MLNTRARGISSVKDNLVGRALVHDEIPDVWNELHPHLQRSVSASDGLMSMDWLYKWLCKAEASALVTAREGEIESVLVVKVEVYPWHRAARIVACGGKDLESAMKHFDLLQSWALVNDCSEIEGWVDPAMARLVRKFGFRPKKEIVSFSLGSKLQ